MSPKEYIKNVKKTESPMFNHVSERIIHGIIGCVSESGEMADNLKKAIFYKDKGLDKNNLKEEIGDITWYLAILCDELKISFEKIFELNIAKLKIRYPDRVQTGRALNRNIEAEQRIFKDDKNEQNKIKEKKAISKRVVKKD